ncbi:F-box protein [Phytophthora palmivora]|uniref:F-box protein n=1 Tax=Phytophthora palmivora TaxID=4796 RepID=A0A2P4X313_9STRA|nr:F-box protein [Phytophthora palmivora]
MALVENRTLVLLAPVYRDVCSTSRSTPVELQRTADDWLKLVFSTPDGLVEKEVACINSHDGCRCDYVRLLRSLMVLSERKTLTVTGKYVVETVDSNPIATLEMSVKISSHANIGESLKAFEFVMSHLQIEGLSIARRSEKSRKEARKCEFLDATCSSCHVVGCRLHSWEADEVLGPKSKLHLPDVFQSLMIHMEAEQLEIRDDAAFVTRAENSSKQQLSITDLPTNTLHTVVQLMTAKEIAVLSQVCSLFRHLAYEVVPGLNLVLYEHQRKGLKWMLYRETPSLINRSLLHPFIFPRRPGQKTKVGINLLDFKVVEQVDTRARDMCGGMFCDEPGLGKTITMLALILRTKGHSTRNVQMQDETENTLDANLRYARSQDRSVPAEKLVSSGASLIVVPDPLVEHWKYQIEVHVVQGALRAFIDEGNGGLPSNSNLAAYDVVVISFSRLAKEWKLHRPASGLEERMPERYGFEGSQRYTDGTIRGEVSSLLTVHWVRVIVDEGHKLGGQTPTNLMRMARILSAERRWVMTGTPTPNTLQSADLRFMHGLLVFLRNKPYGQPDGRAWTKAIARPFEQNQPIGYYRLQSLLSRIMMRHTKESIQEILPEPIRHTVYIDPTPSEHAQYNVVAAAVRANLVITNLDPHGPGNQHLDSLLNPINRKEALRVVSNLQFACCGGVKTEVVLSNKARLETINMLTELDVDSNNISTVVEYLRRVTLPGMTTKCGSCNRNLQLLMIIPCGHLCCADCVEDRFNKIGPSCFLCKEVFDPEVFQELQPGFDFREVDDANDKKRNSDVRQGSRGQQHGITQRQPPSNRHYWIVDASKIFYVATRVRELKKEFARRPAMHGAGQNQQPRYVKVIIFSQFTEFIWRTKLAFMQQKIPTADFITLVNPKARMKALKRFRTDPSLNVLLLSELGSHGLDLSFVTHVFLMEEIWDKSLEQQVVSRAHRMGAQQAVEVEQLRMRGSVESEIAKVNEFNENKVDPPRIVHDLGPPTRTRKRPRSGGNTLLNVAGKKKRKRNYARKVPTGNKSTFLQRKLDYVLNHLRLLDTSAAAAPRQVRFSVVDEKDNITIRQGIHNVAVSSQTVPPTPNVTRDTAKRSTTSTVTVPSPSTPVSVTEMTSERRLSVQPSTPGECIVIDDDPVDSQPQFPACISRAKETKATPEIIVIDDSSSSDPGENSSDKSDGDASMSSSNSSSCCADNEGHSSGEDSDDDSDDSDEESKALLSKLIKTAQRHFARSRQVTSQSSNTTVIPNSPKPVVKVEPVQEIDDEETETE